MKLYIPLFLVFFISLSLAEKIEIKSADGYRSDLHTVEGVFKSKYESNFPYVCYDKRIQVISDNNRYVTYKGCRRIDVSCQSTGRVHFGKYPNDYKAYQALNRCQTARPKFID